MSEDFMGANAPKREELEYASELSELTVEEYLDDVEIPYVTEEVSDNTKQIECIGGYIDGLYIHIEVNDNGREIFDIFKIKSHTGITNHQYLIDKNSSVAYYGGVES